MFHLLIKRDFLPIERMLEILFNLFWMIYVYVQLMSSNFICQQPPFSLHLWKLQPPIHYTIETEAVSNENHQCTPMQFIKFPTDWARNMQKNTLQWKSLLNREMRCNISCWDAFLSESCRWQRAVRGSWRNASKPSDAFSDGPSPRSWAWEALSN